MRRAGDGILVDAKHGAEKARNEVNVVALGGGGDNDAARVELGQAREVRLQFYQRLFVGDLHEMVHPVLAAPQNLRAKRLGQAVGRLAARRRFGGEIHFNHILLAAHLEHAAAGGE